MASSEVRDRKERGLSREVPFGAWAAGPDGMHIHVHLAEATKQETRRSLLPWLAGAAAVVVAFGIGQLTASPSSGHAADAGLRAPPPTVMRAVPSLPDAPLQLAPARGAEVQLSPLPQLPLMLQQQLAQPPRVALPSPAPASVVAGTPGTPPRNAFGLER
ncbi:hypothetical protein ACI2KH_14625 [Roseomonas mucosa]|uniref:hypothetical protein n=1 Tax=Roseomonas mucosa TaxID=207340 RepID=UPI00385163EE